MILFYLLRDHLRSTDWIEFVKKFKDFSGIKDINMMVLKIIDKKAFELCVHQVEKTNGDLRNSFQILRTTLN